MFCPNCGNNCENANFCPKCGTKLPQQAGNESAVWQIGMPCPHCGGTKLEGNCCAFCGAQLVTEAQVESAPEVSSDIPYGVYKGVSSSITLYKTACVVMNRTFLIKKYETRIPYDQITNVVYVCPPDDKGELGYLLIRWQGNKSVPIREDNNFAGDKTTIMTTYVYEPLFYHIYYMLKTVAPASAEFRMVMPPVVETDLDLLLSDVEIDYYFKQFAPYRDRAIDVMCKKTGMNKSTVKRVVDRAFDERQKLLYAADPSESVRDLNRIVNDIERKKAEEQEKIEERRREREKMSELENAIVRANRRT